jgi:hypothetical protein
VFAASVRAFVTHVTMRTSIAGQRVGALVRGGADGTIFPEVDIKQMPDHVMVLDRDRPPCPR